MVFMRGAREHSPSGMACRQTKKCAKETTGSDNGGRVEHYHSRHVILTLEMLVDTCYPCIPGLGLVIGVCLKEDSATRKLFAFAGEREFPGKLEFHLL